MDSERISSVLIDEIKGNRSMTINQKALLLALFETRGNISKAEQLAQVSREVHFNAINNNKHYQKYFALVNESVLDMVEDRLMQRLELGDFKAIEFFLVRKGKSRGYQPEININLPPVSFNINFGGNPDLQKTIELPITPSEEVDDIGFRNTAPLIETKENPDRE